MHANVLTLCSVNEIDPGILGIMYPVLVLFPFLYLNINKEASKQTKQNKISRKQFKG